MDPTAGDQCPSAVTVRRNPHRRSRPTPASTAAAGNPTPSCPVPKVPFPTDEILSMDISNSKPDPENLRVFLRIRPLPKPLENRSRLAGDSKSRSKNAWPQDPRNAAREQQPKKKKTKSPSGEVCVKVNSAGSVTVSPPLALQEPNRNKSEVYDGFSHVFSPESSQEEVYATMVKPLVEDFLKGKSGMLAAMGPSGSGKTHTVFGSPREPGMVPLALQHIFKTASDGIVESSWSFFVSMFEVSTEGKAERWIDLSPNGGEITMQKSSLKGLQETAISDSRQAESLVAQAMQKRATATTNSNNQSSRSQCIINIRGVGNQSDGEDTNKTIDVVLSIVDLAGAEREKRTGNQGTRLLESNFINNTSMVFGLCLRSLLEHQKNPKKSMQKHFQNSLLTKYLRDYLEGKKRMSLILTVKSGEEDYRDTSHLLRHASPYMEIKFNNAEEPSNISNKRHIQTFSRTENRKRIKLTGSESRMIEQEKSIETEGGVTKEERTSKLETSGGPEPCYVNAADEVRNHQIMQSFAKTIWNVLKEYNRKLEVANNEIKNLRESLLTEETRHLKLKKELTDFKSCTCSHTKSNIDQASFSGRCNNSDRLKRLDLSSKEDDESISEVQGSGCVDNEPDGYASTFQNHDEKQSDATVKTVDVVDDNYACPGPGMTNHLNNQLCEDYSGSGHGSEDRCKPKCVPVVDNYPDADLSGILANSSESVVLHRNDSCSSVELDDLLSEEDEESSDVVSTENCTKAKESIHVTSSEGLHMDKSERSGLPVSSSLLPSSNFKNDIKKSKEDVLTKKCNNTNIPDCEPRVDTCTKPEKPKRRLLPASATLLRNFSILDPEDDSEKPKGGKKSAAEERTRTKGSISLVRLLQSNLHLRI